MSALSELEQKFILHWGEMGNKWGINRTVAHIHALLLVSAKPLSADEIAAALSIARSNVSTSIKELLGWEIIKSVPILGDRKEHYEAIKEPWEMFRIIAEKRKRREIDPTVDALRQCVQDFDQHPNEPAHVKAQLSALLDFFETVTSSYEQTNKLPTPVLIKLFKLDNRVEKLLALLPGFKPKL